MEVSLSELKEKEIINVIDGKKLGRVIDILFETSNGSVKGIVVPGEKKLFRKGDDIFIPLDKLKKIGDDVILVSLQIVGSGMYSNRSEIVYANSYDGYPKISKNVSQTYQPNNKNNSFVRYRRIDNKKYK